MSEHATLAGTDARRDDVGAPQPACVARRAEIAVGEMIVRTWAGRPVAIACTESGLAAFPANCPHAGFLFDEGPLSAGSEIECPMHGARFDARTGALLGGPGRSALERLALAVIGDEIWLGAEQASP